MDGVDEGAGVLRVVVRVHAVAEVGDVAGRAEGGEHAEDFGADRLGRGVEDARVEVALEGGAVADDLAGGPGLLLRGASATKQSRME